MSKKHDIKTPKNEIVKTQNGTARLIWSTGFAGKWGGQYSEAQRFIDMQVLNLSSDYIPFRTGMLEQSGLQGTDIGSGIVEWIAIYAKKQYYDTAESRPYNPMRGGMWFERMKADHGASIIAGAKRKAGGGV